MEALFGLVTSPIGIIVIAIFILGLVLLAHFLSKKNPTDTLTISESQTNRQKAITNGDIVVAAGQKGTGNPFKANNSLYSDLIKSLEDRERFLINLQPLTANVGGYIGPVSEGVFSLDFYIQNALRAGIRSFILPISTYMDDNKVPPNWPYSNKPAIVFRDAKGTILSKNGAQVAEFCKSLMTYKQENSIQADEPILLTLCPVQGYVPDPVQKEKEYVMLMRDIATELKALDSSLLKTYGQLGSVVGGARESEVLTQIPLSDLKGKILIATTFDTRLGLKDKYKNMRPSLYEYSNFLMQPMVGETTQSSNILSGTTTSNSSKYLRLSDVVGSKVNYVDMTRTVWHTTILDDPSVIPKPEDIAAATKVGIQSIPIPFFYTESEDVLKIWKQWGGYAWRLKEKDARFIKPAPIVPAKPSETMNARVSSNLQPGQTRIQ